MRSLPTIIVMIFSLTSCAYTPDVKLKPGESFLYSQDLKTCEKLAKREQKTSIDNTLSYTATGALTGTIGGAIVGNAQAGALIGTLVGVTIGSLVDIFESSDSYKSLVDECLENRGYEVLK